MTETIFLEKRGALLDRKNKLLKEINEEYAQICGEFKNANSPVENLKVYELVENGRKRRGFKRFVIYTQEITVYDEGDIFIRVGGWWLDAVNVPTKWDTMTVIGISNPAVFKLSENQINEKHPYENNENEQ